jgi:hypothetical protein
MGRPREFKYKKLPREVVGVCVAVICDYERRRREIERGALSERLFSSYLRYNTIVDSALECVEANAQREMRLDIASGRGYERSIISSMYCKDAYYNRKREVIYRMAELLELI